MKDNLIIKGWNYFIINLRDSIKLLKVAIVNTSLSVFIINNFPNSIESKI